MTFRNARRRRAPTRLRVAGDGVAMTTAGVGFRKVPCIAPGGTVAVSVDPSGRQWILLESVP